MDLATRIKGLIKEADIYRAQGLFAEARDNYANAISLIESLSQVKNKEKLLAGLVQKIRGIDAQIEKVENAPTAPELSPETQSLIKRLFSFSRSDSEDNAALDGAIALTKFGQYSRAIEEFEALIDRQDVRLVAAKNILRCHLAMDAIAAATDQYGRWRQDPRFDDELLEKIRSFLDSLLKQRNVDVQLPGPIGEEDHLVPVLVEIDEPEDDDEVLDISAVRFTAPGGVAEGKPIEYEVSFQSGNVISILISERDKSVIEALRIGETIADVELTSAVAIFNGTAKIMAKNQIKVGPRKGYFSVDLQIKNR